MLIETLFLQLFEPDQSEIKEIVQEIVNIYNGVIFKNGTGIRWVIEFQLVDHIVTAGQWFAIPVLHYKQKHNSRLLTNKLKKRPKSKTLMLLC